MGASVEGTQMSNTPRTDAATVRMERLDGDIDEVVSADFARTLERELIAARSTTGAPVAWMYEENGENMFGHPDGYRPKDAVPLYAQAPPVEEEAIGHARYEYVRTLSPRQFSALFDEALHGDRFDALVDRYRDAGEKPK